MCFIFSKNKHNSAIWLYFLKILMVTADRFLLKKLNIQIKHRNSLTKSDFPIRNVIVFQLLQAVVLLSFHT